MRILILGGSTEAGVLARALVAYPGHECVLSLAGRTANPALPPLPYRVGGFGGIPGLVCYLRQQAIDLVIDATHPFAERMSANAQSACREAGIQLAVFSRPPWTPVAGDRWVETVDAASAAAALGTRHRHVFLTVGRLQLAAFEAAPQHEYLIRSIDPPDPAPALPQHRLLLARGPFNVADELRLMQREAIDVLVTKNSGGEAARAKLEAARLHGIEVILIRPPQRPAVTTYYNLNDVLSAIEALAAHQ